jgi:hypothetical protein
MSEQMPQQLNNNDHDLLIRLDQKVGNLVDEMRLMRDDTARRLNVVEENKVNKSDFNEARVQNQRALIELDANIKATMLERSLNRDKQIESLNKRMDLIEDTVKSLSRYVYIGVGISMAISALISFVAPLLGKLFK